MTAIRLTPRQRECLRHVYERRTTKEIAAVTGLSPGTVDSYIAEAVAALGARNRRHAAEMAFGGAPTGPPEVRGGEKTGVDLDPTPHPVPLPTGRMDRMADLLPIRAKGAIGNDTHPILRLVQVLVLAMCGAVAFGMLAVGAEVLARLLG